VGAYEREDAKLFEELVALAPGRLGRGWPRAVPRLHGRLGLALLETKARVVVGVLVHLVRVRVRVRVRERARVRVRHRVHLAGGRASSHVNTC
jgi:hypothetical protein